MIKIAIIDVIGLTYDGSTLSKRGLGGSESAVILMAKELHDLGAQVTVFNNCIDKEASPGIYGGVEYIDLSQIENLNDPKFDVVIGSRTVAPFLPPEIWPRWSYRVDVHERIRRHAKLKILWLHDTFCAGDEFLEELVVKGHIDEIFTLSDFHTSYVTTCDHGNRRNFEVLKNKIFMTRNGITKYHEEVDISAKDPNLFVYNSSVSKGMVPLVERIWPEVKRRFPDAQLKIIGGYYRFRENLAPDEQEQRWRTLANDPSNPEKGIEFTGIIKQSEIADILAKSSFMIYPGAFPETFGISTLESLAYNTPLITTRFGALEETAIEQACYLIDYAITPNSLFQRINENDQVNRFIDMVSNVYQNRYLHQQKMYACNIVKDICTWDTVALQWKQHIYKKLGLYLPKEEYRAVSKLNARIHQVFGRRMYNKEEFYLPRKQEQKIVVITPMYNASQYIEKCIESVVTQDYDNWEMYIIDDASSDNGYDKALKYADDRIHVIRNEENCGAVYNQIRSIRSACSDTDIVMLIDGDDSLVNDNQIFHYFNNLYDGSTEFTYGSCWSMVDNIPLVAQNYPEKIKQDRAYRDHRFNWNMPYTHLRTFQAKLILEADDSNFKDDNGNWYGAGGDGSVFYTAIENAEPSKVKVVQDIFYNYNDTSPLNDYKINGDEQTKNANHILSRKQNARKEKFSVIIPTMWRAMDLTPQLLDSLVAHELVGEVIIINNEVESTPDLESLKHSKIVMLNQEGNILVNPAWNLGAQIAKHNKLCFCNDDIVFDTKLFDKIYSRVTPEFGPHGIIWGKAEYNQPPTTDGSIDFKEWQPGDVIHCFGQLFFQHRDNWVPVISELKLFFGDDWLFHNSLSRGRNPWLIYNINFESRNSATGLCEDIVPIVNERYAAEKPIFEQWSIDNPIVKKEKRMKKILIAIPTNKYIETATMKAIYDLEVPEGYTTELQFFYGYQVDQIRNLIAEWARHYDYLFSVDSDVSFAPDTLKKLLAHNKDMVSGLYIQRKPGQHILELYRNGTNIPYQDIEGRGLVEIDGCGFGCVLINSDVIREMEYPHFVYKSALDHKDTVSEDTYFCLKAKSKGFRVYADTSILCDHHGATVMRVESQKEKTKPTPTLSEKEQHLIMLSDIRLMPPKHVEYLYKMRDEGANPKVVYDIGACVLHWTREATNVWPAHYIAFDAMDEAKAVYEKFGVDHYMGLLSDQDHKELKFYKNVESPGGNSYYKENTKYSVDADKLFGDFNAVTLKAMTLDTVVAWRGFPPPDLIKIDVQGAELDVLKGATKALQSAKDVIVELQTVEYNTGAPRDEEVIQYLATLGFKLKTRMFSENGTATDGDYHFVRS